MTQQGLRCHKTDQSDKQTKQTKFLLKDARKIIPHSSGLVDNTSNKKCVDINDTFNTIYLIEYLFSKLEL